MVCTVNIIKEIYEELNLLRTNPESYIPILEEYRTLFDNEYEYDDPETRARIRTMDGIGAVDEALAFLREMTPVPAIRFLSIGLCRAARDLVNSHSISGKTGSLTEDGRDLEARIDRYGTRIGSFAECTNYGQNKATEIIKQLLIDDGGRKSFQRLVTVCSCNARKSSKFNCAHI